MKTNDQWTRVRMCKSNCIVIGEIVLKIKHQIGSVFMDMLNHAIVWRWERWKKFFA